MGDVDLENINSSESLAILEVPPASLVLVVGTGDGSLARGLADQGCRVIGIATEPKRSSAAEPYCERLIADDLEQLDLATTLPGFEFDAILLLDVIARVHDPIGLLRQTAARLHPRGRMIVSVRNVTHAAVRLQLLAGRFDSPEGPSHDRQLLHFDRAGFERLLSEAGLTVLDRMRTVASLTETEIAIDRDAFPPDAIALALSDDDAETHQFVYIVAPGTPRAPGERAASLGEVLQQRALQAERGRIEAQARARALEERAAQLQRELDGAIQVEIEARERIGWLDEELRQRIAELDTQHEALQDLRRDLAIKDVQLAQLQAQLAPVRSMLDTRHRITDWLIANVKRMPGIHRALKRLRRGH